MFAASETIDVTDAKLAADFGLGDREYTHVENTLGRVPTRTELGVFLWYVERTLLLQVDPPLVKDATQRWRICTRWPWLACWRRRCGRWLGRCV